MTTQRIEFATVDGLILGHATLADGVLSYDDPGIRQTFAARVKLFGVERAFRWFSNYSNGYTRSYLVDAAATP